MLKWWFLGLAAVSGPKSCDSGKHETSAPHTTIALEVSGERTAEVGAEAFADGWSIRYEKFRLAPTFGIDPAPDYLKNDGPYVGIGQGEYYFGGDLLELSKPTTTQEVGGWVLAGHSPGWGMLLRRSPAESGHVPTDTSLRVVGSATGPGGERRRFDWAFIHEVTFARCVPVGEKALVLPEGGALTVQVTLDGVALFKDQTAREAKARFAPFAEADTDQDGDITLPELRAATASQLGAVNLYELLNARLAQLVAPDFSCEVSMPTCQDRPVSFGACERGDLADKDFDGDGSKNCLDDDIDGDGIANALDCDPFTRARDLSLCDGADRNEKDSDDDGLRNCEDPDIDDDGILNDNDGRPYANPYVAKEK
jgi:hypothetical protein